MVESSFERGKRYELVVGLEGERPHYQYRNLIYRGRKQARDAMYLVFEASFVVLLIEPDDIIEASEMKRRYSL